MKISENLRKYLELERQVFEWRASHPDDTPEEDALMDEMESIWWKLTEKERTWLNRRPSIDHGKGLSGQ